MTHMWCFIAVALKLLKIPALQHLLTLLEYNQAVISALYWLVHAMMIVFLDFVYR